ELTQTERTLAFQRILRFPHVGLKEPRLHDIAARLGALDEGWIDWLMEELPEGLPPLAKRKLRQTARSLDRIRGLRKRAGEALAYDIEDTVVLRDPRDLALTHEIAEDRIDRVQGVLHCLTSRKQDCGGALDHPLALRQRAGQPSQRQGLTLTTIHRSKGLEWPVVLIPGLNDRYLPHIPKEPDDLESHLQSERRLFYVAMTRAQQALYLLVPPAPARKGDTELSPFV